MRRTLSRAASKGHRQRGITLIEMCVVVAVLVIMAALIERSFTHVKDGLAQRAFASNLRSEVIRARLQALQDGQIVTMQYNGAGPEFTLSEPPLPDTDSNQTPELVTDLQQQTTNPIHTLPVPSGVTFPDFKSGTTDQDGGSWQLHFYPDGKSDGGGIQVSIGQVSQSLKIDTHGETTWVAGALPDTTNDVWPAGTYDQRTTS